MQRVEFLRRYCEICEKETKHERHITAMGCGDLVMVLCTWGLWMLVRWFFAPCFRCSVCGKAWRKLVKQ